jgi:hypothetical protein
MEITTYIADKGNYKLLRIINTQTEDTIIEFGKYFSTIEEIEEFKKTTLFKSIYLSVYNLINI